MGISSNFIVIFFRDRDSVVNKKLIYLYLKSITVMATNKFFKTLLFTLTIAVSLFGFSVENSFAYPVFAQQGYSNPRAANGKLACANCHLNQKAIEIEAPQGVLPNSVFEVEIKVPYDVNRRQISADGKPADFNVGGILIL